LPLDLACGVAAALDRELRECRVQTGVGCGEGGHVADREHLRVAR
jgi:hypothetical protein